MKPSALKRNLPHLRAQRRPIFIWGKSGIGKSSVIHQYAKADELELRDVRLSQLDAIDLRGFPMPNAKEKKTEWLPADFLPTKADKPGILFLDECNGAKPAVASASYQLILDGRLGNYVFPDHWWIVAAGNNVADRGVTNAMPAPLNNRFLHIDYELDGDDWHKQAADDGIHTHMRAYLRLKQGNLHVFDPAINPRCFPTPRSWYMANEIYANPAYDALSKLELIKGCVGEGAGAEFIGFCRDIAQMPDLDAIAMNPEKAKLPATPAITHAVVTTLVDDKVTKQNFDRYMLYINRLAREIQVVFVRGSVHKDETVTQTKSYMDWALKNQDILVG